MKLFKCKTLPSLPRSRFLDVTQRSPKHCVTSKKRLRGRLDSALTKHHLSKMTTSGSFRSHLTNPQNEFQGHFSGKVREDNMQYFLVVPLINFIILSCQTVWLH